MLHHIIIVVLKHIILHIFKSWRTVMYHIRLFFAKLSAAAAAAMTRSLRCIELITKLRTMTACTTSTTTWCLPLLTASHRHRIAIAAFLIVFEQIGISMRRCLQLHTIVFANTTTTSTTSTSTIIQQMLSLHFSAMTRDKQVQETRVFVVEYNIQQLESFLVHLFLLFAGKHIRTQQRHPSPYKRHIISNRVQCFEFLRHFDHCVQDTNRFFVFWRT
mmetsp:Transcript_41483/g.68283  ORF Transcript_41483/g.68283 Transcript_41483/m.68283 type:complete len:217 (+) Transcript_41483:1298-1948(+)